MGQYFIVIVAMSNTSDVLAGLVITKIFWEKLVTVKWSLVGSMYMLLTRAKIQCGFFGISNAKCMNIYT